MIPSEQALSPIAKLDFKNLKATKITSSLLFQQLFKRGCQ